MKTLLLWLLLAASAFAQDFQRGAQMPTGDAATDIDIPQGQSYTIRGSGGGRSGKANNGTQLVPAALDQPFIVRIGEAPRGGVALGCSIRDVSFWANASRDASTNALKLTYQGDGLVLRSWGGLSIENVGFYGCKRGLILDATQKGTGLTARRCWFANNGTGLYVDLSKYENRVVNRVDGCYVNGNDVGVEIADPGPKPFVLRDYYAENNWFAGLIHHKGTTVLESSYVEEGTRDIAGTRHPADDILVPSVAILGGKVVFRNMENANYVYVGPQGTFEADADSSSAINYIVLWKDDPRVAEFARLWRPRVSVSGVPHIYRILVTDRQWEKGAELTVKGVRPQ